MAWENDRLGRAKCADFLMNYLTKLYSDGGVQHFVLAIDAEWGEGKTFLFENWKDDLVDQGYPVIYFNAWENDFSDDPLVAIISDLNDQLESYYARLPAVKKAARSLMRIAPGVIKSGFKLIGIATAKKLFGMGFEELNELWDGDSDKSSSHENEGGVNIEKTADKFSELIFKEHTAKKLGIKDFRESLTALVETLSTEQHDLKLPLFIFVDELDRCRPNYAVELLEGIKHLFGVPGIYFVVATNMRQLAHSVGVLYGSNFESERYLKRFFDQEYIIPNPDRFRFIELLFEGIMQSFLDLMIALGLGAAIGLERRLNGHVAGIHTHSMVSLGAAIFAVIGTVNGYQDGTRIIGQVVTGVGFLCSGVIMRDGFSIRGINTATSIWCAAAVGCLASIHQLIMACGVTVLIVIANGLLHLFEHRLPWLSHPIEEKIVPPSQNLKS